MNLALTGKYPYLSHPAYKAYSSEVSLCHTPSKKNW